VIAVNVDHVTFRYIADPVLTDLAWEIHDDRCVGLIGANGCGKSTLLRLIAGELETDAGSIVRRKDLSIGYLRQEPELDPGNTVWEEAFGASTELARVEAGLEAVEAKLATPAVFSNEAALARVLDHQARLLEEFERLGGANYEGRVRSTLRSLGFADADFGHLIGALSGGQKKLLGLAKLLIVQPDLLLLDEPDNHLDLAGKAFLERFISSYSGAVVIVSHDRYLLDMVVDEIAEIEDGKLQRYQGSYSEYVFEKQARLQRQLQLFQAQQKEITRLEQAAKRLMMWGQVYDNGKFSRRGKSILKRLEKIDRVEKPITERRRMGLELTGWRGSTKVLDIVDLYKWFPPQTNVEEREHSDGRIVLAGLNLLVWHGERVGVVGPNGAGKSVFFRLILGKDEPTSGEIKVGPSVTVGHYAQEHETLDYGRTLIDTVRQVARLSEDGAVRFLGRFLFSYEQSRGLVGSLSGGERARLQMALLMLSGANFLLLDEPTNNLDIASAEVLEDVLADFEGTVLVISHDRYFLDRVVDRIVELDEGTLREYLGGYSAYQAAKMAVELRAGGAERTRTRKRKKENLTASW